MAKKTTKKTTKKKTKTSKSAKATKTVKEPVRSDAKRIDWDVAAKYVESQCTQEEIASLFGMSRKNFTDRLKRELGLTWPQFFELHAGRGRASLRRQIHKKAMEGNVTLMQHLGKTVLGQNEKIQHEHSGPGGSEVRFKNTSDDEIQTQLDQVLKSLSVLSEES